MWGLIKNLHRSSYQGPAKKTSGLSLKLQARHRGLVGRTGLPVGNIGTERNWPTQIWLIVQELCESRGGRPELSVLTSLLVSVDVKNY